MKAVRRASPLIAVTSGDPAGIGPEIIAKLFSRYRPRDSLALVVGAPSLFDPWRKRFRFRCPVVNSVDEAREVAGQSAGSRPRVVILDTSVRAEFPIASASKGGGLHAATAVRLACELARNGSAAAIVTAPTSKKSLNLAHFDFPGHTEMLAHYLNAPHCQMMMVYRDLRVVPVTRHVPIAEVSRILTEDRLLACVRVTWDSLRAVFAVRRPRIAVAGLNPHAGEDGTIGAEDRDVIAPAIERLRAEGIDVTGPHPADALFQSAPEAVAARTRGRAAGRTGATAWRSRCDAYVTMYHDQGLVPFKMLARRRGVNVTLGLPVVRTSVDHGTAYDITGRGIAETRSLFAAYRLAEDLVARSARRRTRP